MSDNKMGGVPDESRNALYKLMEKLDAGNDGRWAKVIRKITKLGPKKALRRLKRT